MSSPGVQECETIQLIEPDGELPVASSQGISDPALTERGDVVLVTNQSSVSVTFSTAKTNASYRFEYLYVDDLGDNNPGTIQAVPVIQTALGFTVELAGVPPQDGYILRWRVVVVDFQSVVQTDLAENLYLQLNHTIGEQVAQPVQDIIFTNPRSTTSYGFSELRVENLVDDPLLQSPIFVQVVEKRLDGFKIAINPIPQTPNYYLAVRTP